MIVTISANRHVWFAGLWLGQEGWANWDKRKLSVDIQSNIISVLYVTTLWSLGKKKLVG